MDEVTLDGKKYISAKQAAEITKYSQDYIGQLVRAGTLPGRLIGRARFVEEEALLQYSESIKSHNQESRQSVFTGGSVPAEVETSDIINKTKYPEPMSETPAEMENYLYGWQSRSTFYETTPEAKARETKIPIKVSPSIPAGNVSKNGSAIFSGILPYATILATFFIVISAAYIFLYPSIRAENKISYVAPQAVEERTGAEQTAALANAGIFSDFSGNLKTAVDSLALGVYHGISGGGNRLISFLNNLFSGGDGGLLSFFRKDTKEVSVNESSKSPQEVTVKITSPTKTANAPISLKTSPAGQEQPEAATQSPKIIERIIERVVEKVPATTVSTVTEPAPEASSAEVDSKLEQLKNKVFSEIYKVADGLSNKTNTVYQAVSLTNKIDTLDRVSISNASITGSTYAGSVSGTTGTFSNSLSVTGGLSGSSGSFSGDLTVSGTPTFYGALSVPYLSATSTTATSTFSGRLLVSLVPTIAHTFSSWSSGVSGSNPLNASFLINPATAGADTNLLALAVGDSAKFLIDAEGDVFANSLTAVGGVTLSTTTASTFSVENNTTLGDSITDTTTVNGTLVVTGTTTSSTVAGNFGVGTTSPYAKLSVVGQAVAEYFTATSTTATSTFAGGFSAAGSSGLTVLQNGNVGIGTTTPSALFSLGTSLGKKLLLYDGGNLSAATGFGLQSNLLEIIGGDSNVDYTFGYGTSGSLTRLVTLKGSGNFGIGTTSPYAKLSVVGQAVAEYFTATSTTATSTFAGAVGIGTSSPISLLTLVSPSTVPQLYLGQTNLGGGWKIGTDADDGHLHIISRQGVTDTERMTIQYGGNVGIGTTSPTAKLHIGGTAGTDGVKFPDGTLQTTAPRTPTLQTFTSSGTWTKPSGVTKIKVTVVGGGGGGGSYSGGIYGSGGGGGGACVKYINVTSITSETVTIGAAGAASSGGSGGTGGTSSFGAHCSATGGLGGTAGGPSSGGAGGIGSSGDLNIRGNPGESSYGTNPGHIGGGSIFAGGGGGAGGSPTYGGGGSTAYPEGNAGASGVIIVEEY